MIVATNTFPAPAYSQTSERNCDANPVVKLPVSPIDVHLELEMNDNSEVSFKVSFMDNGTANPHPHIDYLLEISDSNGTRIFNAAPPGQPTLHTAEGVVTIPYAFQKKGDYSVDVIVYGVDFVPTIPQVATFPCNDIPEFPLGIVGVLAGIMGGIIVISRYRK
jgi:hypothetical protein